MSDAPTKQTVLVTGSSGTIGRLTCTALESRGHTVRRFDRAPDPDGAETIIGQIEDADAIADAVAGCDAVVHLAARVNDDDFMSVLLPSNIIAVHHVLEAARQAGVERVVLASSLQVITAMSQRLDRPIREEDGTLPVNGYAVTKVFAEAMGQMYAAKHGLSVIALRVGWMPRSVDDVYRIADANVPSHYWSHRDCMGLMPLLVETAEIDFAIVYGFSADGEQVVDMQPTYERVGYTPRDRFPEGMVLFDFPE